ncbi:MAG: hypothetical protein ACM3SY_04770 [Candidatus Omnitrophota bacterium]
MQSPWNNSKETPELRIETGMHTAKISRIGIDERELYLVTGSEDKTVRVWELTTGRLLRVLRPPIGPGYEGKIYAVAISPDGEEIACGGYTGANSNYNIYIFNRSGGELKKQISGLLNPILHLAYSRDGKYLAACLWGSNGIRLYRASDYTEIFKDTSYNDSSSWADWDRTGRLVTTCYDGYIRLYSSVSTGLNKIKETKCSPGTLPFSVAFSPDGSRVAAGFDQSAKIAVLSGHDLSLLVEPDTKGVDNGNLGRVAWSADSSTLYAGGLYHANGSRPILCWSVDQHGKTGTYAVLEGASDTIMHIRPLTSGNIVFGAADPAWGRIDRAGKRILLKTAEVADYRHMLNRFRISRDGSKIQFRYTFEGHTPATFSLASRQITLNPGENPELIAPAIESHGIPIDNWKDSYHPRLNGKEVPLKTYECSRSLAIAPDHQSFLLGTEWNLRCFDCQGKELWSQPAPGVAWSVNISGDGKMAIAAFADGTIRWYRYTDGKPLLAFFPHNDRKRWVLWTPSGYYDASPGGEDIIGWHVNRGPDKEANFFPVSRFRSTYYRPDVIDQILNSLDEEKALAAANALSGKGKRDTNIYAFLPPTVSILSPEDGTTVKSTEIQIKYRMGNPSGEPITGVRFLIDGRPAPGTHGVQLIDNPIFIEANATLSIPPKDCLISIIAANRIAIGEPATILLRWETPDMNGLKPKLYVLAVGVSQYNDPLLCLKYPAKDAWDFCAALKRQEGGLYSSVTVNPITDRDATKENILKGMEWLERQVTLKDIGILFLAGHGQSDHKGKYCFLPTDVDVDSLKSSAIGFTDIKETVSNLPGKSLLFTDTCRAGCVTGSRSSAPDIDALVNELISAENGVIVFAATQSRQNALENPRWKNGAFTLALVEGLNGKALADKEKITVMGLARYIAERVKELTNGKQSPTVEIPKTMPDIPIAVKR